jgi:REP element-mobilizing transposase RayT
MWNASCEIFLGHKFWARGYFVSTIGRDEEMIRTYIKKSGDGGQAVGSVAA